MTNKIDKQLRKVIKQKMSRNTQSKIAKKLGYSQSYISKILSGKETPKNLPEILEKINSQLNFTKFSIN